MKIRHVMFGLAAAAPIGMLAPPASAAITKFVCWDADGNSVVNPSDPSMFEHCIEQPSSGGGDGSGNLPVQCDATLYDQGDIRYRNCTPVAPLQ